MSENYAVGEKDKVQLGKRHLDFENGGKNDPSETPEVFPCRNGHLAENTSNCLFCSCSPSQAKMMQGYLLKGLLHTNDNGESDSRSPNRLKHSISIPQQDLTRKL